VLISLARAFSMTSPGGATWAPPEIPKGKQERQELFTKAEETLKRAFAKCPNYNLLLPPLLSGGVPALQEIKLTLHTPIKPMLGTITRSLDDMLAKFSGRSFTVEYKYDGQRAQIHYDGGRVEIFSRHLENMTSKYPDLVSLIPSICGPGIESFILEGEVVAVDQSTGALQNFQQLSGRGRKNVGIGEVKVGVCLFVFDLMMVNERELLGKPLRERRRLLRDGFLEVGNRFMWVKSLDATSEDGDKIREFFTQAVGERCEGVMVKLLDNDNCGKAGNEAHEAGNEVRSDVHNEGGIEEKKPGKPGKPETTVKGRLRNKPLLATYEPDKRLESWLKVKKDYILDSSETVDLIPIAGWHGNGRKSKWWSPILLAIRNPTTGSLEAVCKCMSGFSDRFYKENRAFYNPDEGDGDDDEEADEEEENTRNPEEEENALRNLDATETARTGTTNCATEKPSYYDVPPDFHPAVWFEAKEVWEVAFADITVSPNYTAGRDVLGGDKGLSLRFPRFIKKRTDKGIEEATSGGELVGRSSRYQNE
jgi:DNA ligase-1